MWKIFLSTIFLFWSLTLRTVICDIGSCMDVSNLFNLDTDRYSGHWNEFGKTDSVSAQTQKCSYYDITKREDGLYDVDHVYHNENTNHGETEYIFARIGNSDMSKNDSAQTNYILGTDYENYAVLYHCDQALIFKSENFLILTRQRKPDEDTIKQAEQVVQENGLGDRQYYTVNQNDCEIL